MKSRHWVLAAALLPTLSYAAGSGGGGGHGGGGEGKGGRPAGPRVVIRMRRYSVPKPQRIKEPAHIMRDDRRITWPTKDDKGAAILQPPMRTPPRHRAIAHDGRLVKTIERQQQDEKDVGRYYWHTHNDVRYCHYLDDHGIHWYGFYHGPAFYWCRYHAGHWWWHDAAFARWVYWSDGFWWWPATTGVLYVYVDNNYYPYDEQGVIVKTPVVEPVPKVLPDPGAGDKSYSPDKSRMLQIAGDQADAYLYDASAEPPILLKDLGQGAAKVRWGGGSKAYILLDFKDGSFALYDMDGNSLDATTSLPATGEEPPGAPPDDAAPPPPPDTP